MTMIWGTRGRTWGFRFLLDGGYRDPLGPYESAFAGIEDDVMAVQWVGDRVALRFSDPLRRTDAAGRRILHDFVLWGDLAPGVDSVEGGRLRVWPIVADAYSALWDGPLPSPEAVEAALKLP